jgi:Zn-dependent protease with chaperone function
VKNQDILISSIAATLASAITYLAQMAMWFGAGHRDGEQRSRSSLGGLLMLLLVPMAAGLIPMAISRTREFSADATSARTLGKCATDDRRAGEAGFDGPADSARRISFDVALEYHAAVLWQIPLQAVLHSSPHCGTDCGAA